MNPTLLAIILVIWLWLFVWWFIWLLLPKDNPSYKKDEALIEDKRAVWKSRNFSEARHFFILFIGWIVLGEIVVNLFDVYVPSWILIIAAAWLSYWIGIISEKQRLKIIEDNVDIDSSIV